MIEKKMFKKFYSILLILFMIMTVCNNTEVQAKVKNLNSEDDVNLVVLFNEDEIDKSLEDLIENLGGEVINNLSEIGAIEVKCSTDLITEIQSYNTVKSLAPNHNIKAPEENVMEFHQNKVMKNNKNSEADLYELYQWDIKRVTNNGKSFDLGSGSHDIVIAVIDSGVKTDHPDLEKNFMGGENFIPQGFNGDNSETGDPDDVEDRLGHGTYVTGTIAANGRTKGVAPDIGFKSYRIFDSEGNTNATIISQAIIKAVDDGVNIINLSMSGYNLKGKCYWTDNNTGIEYNLGDDMAEYELYKRAIKYAVNHNITVITASGNDGVDCGNPQKLTKFLNDQNGQQGFRYEGLTYEVPGSIDGVINVSAIGKTDEIAKYSNYGNNFIDVTAPGGDSSKTGSIFDMCLSTGTTDYWFVEGTSISAPKVSAIAGLILCEDYSLTPKKVAKRIYKSCEQIGDNKSKNYYGSGLVNAYKALYR